MCEISLKLINLLRLKNSGKNYSKCMYKSKMAATWVVKWAQYGIDLPGSLHTNKIPVILGRYPLPRFFCRLSIVPLDMDNGTFKSSHPDVVEKENFLVPASQHGGTSVAEGSP